MTPQRPPARGEKIGGRVRFSFARRGDNVYRVRSMTNNGTTDAGRDATVAPVARARSDKEVAMKNRKPIMLNSNTARAFTADDLTRLVFRGVDVAIVTRFSSCITTRMKATTWKGGADLGTVALVDVAEWAVGHADLQADEGDSGIDDATPVYFTPWADRQRQTTIGALRVVIATVNAANAAKRDAVAATVR